MKWILIFWLMVPPFTSVETGQYDTKNDCLSQGEMQYLALTPVDKKGWDWFCVNTETLGIAGGKSNDN